LSKVNNSKITHLYSKPCFLYCPLRICQNGWNPFGVSIIYRIKCWNEIFKLRITEFCRLQLGEQQHETKVIPSTLNPKWRESFEFRYLNTSGTIIQVSWKDNRFLMSQSYSQVNICSPRIINFNAKSAW
jgi:hypothetical protein